ncbi:MAG: lipoate--protein ligase family protein [Paludibacter sp.]
MKIVRSSNTSASYNLALEEYLFTEFHDEFLFFYVNNPSVILGSNQAVQNEIDLDYCLAKNIDIVRRKSGGGAVYHDNGNLNFSFLGNKSNANIELSGDFLLPIVHILKSLNVDASIGARKDLWVADEYKISGTASQIRKNRTLHHGTLLIDADLEQLALALSVKAIDDTVKATKSVRSKTTNICDYLNIKNDIQIKGTEFIDQFISQACIYFETTLLGDSDFDQNAIQQYELQYLDKNWNLKK